MDDKEKIKGIFLKVFENLREVDFSLERKQAEYENWDSFVHMQLITEIEKQFSLNLNVDEVTGIESANDIYKLVMKYKHGQS